jgi:hypothetical protein
LSGANLTTPFGGIIPSLFPHMAALRRELSPRLRALRERLDTDEAHGADRSAVRQSLTEFRWRLEYTSDEDAARAAWRRAVALADAANLPSALTQDEDGSYGRYTGVWFFKLNTSTDFLLNRKTAPPLAPCFLDRVNDPGRLEAYLRSLVVSRPLLDGVDRRKELNVATADLLRLILHNRPQGYLWHPGLAAVFHRFIAEWQDPETGFFGPEYEIGTDRLRLPDLSMTFHMARYLNGEIGHWPALIETLLRIRDVPYPNGWLSDGRLTAHHAYDVATMCAHGWPRVGAEQQGRVADQIGAMLEALVGSTVADPLADTRTPNETMAESCYFLTAFLDVTGYFEPARRFWTKAEFPRAAKLAACLRQRLRQLNPDEPMVQMALARLDRKIPVV